MGEKSLLKSKTFWGMIAAIILAIISWITGQQSLQAVVLEIVGAVGVIFLRSEIDNNLRNFFNKFNWFTNKTVWVAIAAALGFVISWLAGEIELLQMLIGVVTAISGIFLRSAVEPENPGT
jgi:hypothetical protein